MEADASVGKLYQVPIVNGNAALVEKAGDFAANSALGVTPARTPP